MHLPIGTLLQGGRYEIIRYISSGGFGCTYEARDTKFKNIAKSLAIKEFFVKDFCNRDAATNCISVATQGKAELVEKLRAKFLAEAAALYGFNHPNIVRVTDTFEENGTAYYVMEYINGSSLANIVEKNGPLSEEKALGYIRQVADALKYVHSQNYLHLDVKPHNIMVDGNGRAVLIDFGVSKQYDEVNGANTSTLVGSTPGYAPLEQSGCGIREFSPTTDIYSLGATLFKLVTGMNPPVASEVNENGLPTPAGVSSALFHAIETAMQPRRKDRPQNIDEFLSLLSENGTEGRRPEGLKSKVKTENGKNKEENDGETVLNGNVKGASKREGENLFTHTASESSFDEVKGENGKLVADEFHSIDVVEVPDSAHTVISNEGEKSHSAKNEILRSAQNDNSGGNVISNESEKSHSANNEILPPYSRQNDKDGNEEVERRNEKEHSAGAVISNVGEKSQKNKPGKSLWLILLLLLIAGVGAWFLFSGAGNGDVLKADTTKNLTTGKHNGHDWVDLGLPSGLKWATCNVGASSPSDYGDYYAWGETSTKSSYTDDNSTTYFKEIGDIAGDSTYDVARAKWHGSWRMPTMAEFEELRDSDNCTWEWTTQDGHEGYKVTSKKNGSSIFLPAAGWRDGTSSCCQGSDGSYWGSDRFGERYASIAYHLEFYWERFFANSSRPGYGRSVRPVFQNN